MHTIPLPPNVASDALKNKTHLVIDLENTKVTSGKVINYLTNLQLSFEFAPCTDKGRKFEAFREFIVSKYKTNSTQLIETLIRALSIYHGKDIEGPTFMTAEEIQEFVSQNNDLFESIAEYYNAMPYTMMSMVDQYQKGFLEPMIAEGKLELKKDDHIGVNVMMLAGLPDFIEEYLTWPVSINAGIIFSHSTKANEHVFKLISDRPVNATVSLLYALANQKFAEEPSTTQEA